MFKLCKKTSYHFSVTALQKNVVLFVILSLTRKEIFICFSAFHDIFHFSPSSKACLEKKSVRFGLTFIVLTN